MTTKPDDPKLSASLPKTTIGWYCIAIYTMVGAFVCYGPYGPDTPRGQSTDLGAAVVGSLILYVVIAVMLVAPINLMFINDFLPLEPGPLFFAFVCTGLLYARCSELVLSGKSNESETALAVFIVVSGPVSAIFALVF